MKQLNIAFFLSVSTNCLGGADNTLFMQALLLKPYHNVTIVLPCDEEGKTNTIFQHKCEIHRLQYRIFSYNAATAIRFIDLVDYKRDLQDIEKFVIANKIHVLHSVQINPAVEFISRKLGIPHVMNIYSLEDWEWNIPYLDIFPQYVSSDSEFFLQKWKHYLNCKGRCIRVFDEIGIKKENQKNKSRIVIGAAGTIYTFKNQLAIIKAVEFERKQGRQIQLLLAGEDSSYYANSCKEYVEKHQLQEDIIFLGFVEDMSSFFDRIDIFICASRRESFPASIVEAISCNIPVISTPVGGVPEILADRHNAYITRGYSAAGLAEAIEKYYSDQEEGRLVYILDNEAKTYQKYFSAEAVKHQLEEMYVEVCGLETGSVESSCWNDIEGKLFSMTSYKGIETLEKKDKKCFFSKLLYLYQIKSFIKMGGCYIWGAGKWGKITKVLVECLGGELEIKAFVDSKKTGYLDGIRIIKKEEMEDLYKKFLTENSVQELFLISTCNRVEYYFIIKNYQK